MAQQVWGQGNGEDQAGAAPTDRGEWMLRGCRYQEEKLLSGKEERILMTRDPNTKCQ